MFSCFRVLAPPLKTHGGSIIIRSVPNGTTKVAEVHWALMLMYRASPIMLWSVSALDGYKTEASRFFTLP